MGWEGEERDAGRVVGGGDEGYRESGGIGKNGMQEW